jgi:hypothetical protein
MHTPLAMQMPHQLRQKTMVGGSAGSQGGPGGQIIPLADDETTDDDALDDDALDDDALDDDALDDDALDDAFDDDALDEVVPAPPSDEPPLPVVGPGSPELVSPPVAGAPPAIVGAPPAPPTPCGTPPPSPSLGPSSSATSSPCAQVTDANIENTPSARRP